MLKNCAASCWISPVCVFSKVLRRSVQFDQLFPLRASVRFRSNVKWAAEKARIEAGEPPIDEWAYNDIEKKSGLYKPHHTVEEQIEYMKSQEYYDAYQGFVHHWYRRNHKGQSKVQPPARLFCIDRYGRFNLNHACPICRDEYLFFDYRNPKLMQQFMIWGTDKPMSIFKTKLCREQYIYLQAQIIKAKEHGTLPFAVQFRQFNYKEWYKNWKNDDKDEVALFDPEPVNRAGVHVEDIYPDPLHVFPTHNRDIGTKWDEWWTRHEKFARTVKQRR